MKWERKPICQNFVDDYGWPVDTAPSSPAQALENILTVHAAIFDDTHAQITIGLHTYLFTLDEVDSFVERWNDAVPIKFHIPARL